MSLVHVDLIAFDNLAFQDMLRGHYQQLSADPNSLANLDQGTPSRCSR